MESDRLKCFAVVAMLALLSMRHVLTLAASASAGLPRLPATNVYALVGGVRPSVDAVRPCKRPMLHGPKVCARTFQGRLLRFELLYRLLLCADRRLDLRAPCSGLITL